MAKGKTKAHIPLPPQERPTVERLMRGDWRKDLTEIAGVHHLTDTETHMIDRLFKAQVITADQANAAETFAEIFDLCEFTSKSRDSTRTWEPKGFQNDEGNQWAADTYKEVCRRTGMIGSQVLYRVCKAEQDPRPKSVEQLRHALDCCIEVFKK